MFRLKPILHLTVLFLIGFINTCAIPSAAKDFYVSPEGDDSGRGSLDDPWKTPHKAAKTAKAGDAIFLRQGLYRQPSGKPINFSHTGTVDAPVYMSAFPGETVVLSGFGNFSDLHLWQIHDGSIYCATMLDRREIYMVVQHDRALEPKKNLDELTGPGQWFFDTTLKKLYLWSMHSRHPAHADTQISSANAVIVFDASDTHIIIENLTITGAFYGIRCLPNGGNRIFRRLVFTHLTEDGLKFHTQGNHDDLVESCMFSSYGDFGIDSYGSSYQVFRYNDFTGIHPWKSGGGIKCLAGAHDQTIVGNSLMKMGGLGRESAIELRETDRCLVANNVIALGNGGAIAIYADNHSLASPVDNAFSNQIKIINNTIYHMRRSAVWVAGVSRNISVYNNIIYQLDGDGAGMRIDPGGEIGFDSDYNLFGQPSSMSLKWLDGNYSLPQFQTIFELDLHSQLAEPRFRDAADLDFRLNVSSPAIDAGSPNVDALDDDRDRHARLHGRSVDMGAYEWPGRL